MKPNWTWQRSVALASAAAAAVAVWSLEPGDPGKELFEIPAAHAAGPGGPDTDGDGLTDHFEEVLGTDGSRSDTDGDGYWDAEELARQSNPLNAANVPGSKPTGFSASAGVRTMGGREGSSSGRRTT